MEQLTVAQNDSVQRSQAASTLPLAGENVAEHVLQKAAKQKPEPLVPALTQDVSVSAYVPRSDWSKQREHEAQLVEIDIRAGLSLEDIEDKYGAGIFRNTFAVPHLTKAKTRRNPAEDAFPIVRDTMAFGSFTSKKYHSCEGDLSLLSDEDKKTALSLFLRSRGFDIKDYAQIDNELKEGVFKGKSLDELTEWVFNGYLAEQDKNDNMAAFSRLLDTDKERWLSERGYKDGTDFFVKNAPEEMGANLIAIQKMNPYERRVAVEIAAKMREADSLGEWFTTTYQSRIEEKIGTLSPEKQARIMAMVQALNPKLTRNFFVELAGRVGESISDTYNGLENFLEAGFVRAGAWLNDIEIDDEWERRQQTARANALNTVRTRYAERGVVGNLLMDTGIAFADTAMIMGLGMATGGFGAAAGTFAWFGGGSAGNTYADLVSRGADPGTAFYSALEVGAVEAGSEYLQAVIPLGKGVMNFISGKGAKSMALNMLSKDYFYKVASGEVAATTKTAVLRAAKRGALGMAEETGTELVSVGNKALVYDSLGVAVDGEFLGETVDTVRTMPGVFLLGAAFGTGAAKLKNRGGKMPSVTQFGAEWDLAKLESGKQQAQALRLAGALLDVHTDFDTGTLSARGEDGRLATIDMDLWRDMSTRERRQELEAKFFRGETHDEADVEKAMRFVDFAIKAGDAAASGIAQTQSANAPAGKEEIGDARAAVEAADKETPTSEPEPQAEPTPEAAREALQDFIEHMPIWKELEDLAPDMDISSDLAAAFGYDVEAAHPDVAEALKKLFERGDADATVVQILNEYAKSAIAQAKLTDGNAKANPLALLVEKANAYGDAGGRTGERIPEPAQGEERAGTTIPRTVLDGVPETGKYFGTLALASRANVRHLEALRGNEHSLTRARREVKAVLAGKKKLAQISDTGKALLNAVMKFDGNGRALADWMSAYAAGARKATKSGNKVAAQELDAAAMQFAAGSRENRPAEEYAPHRTEVREDALNEAEENLLKTVSRMNAMTGGNASVKFFDGSALDAAGFIDKDNVIHINRNSAEPLLKTFGHEFTHYLEANKGFAGMKQFILKPDGVCVRAFLARYGFASLENAKAAYKRLYATQGGQNLSDEALEREILADVCGAVLFTRDFDTLFEIRQKNKNFFNRCLDFLRKLFGLVRGTKIENELANAIERYRAVAFEAREVLGTYSGFEQDSAKTHYNPLKPAKSVETSTPEAEKSSNSTKSAQISPEKKAYSDGEQQTATFEQISAGTWSVPAEITAAIPELKGKIVCDAEAYAHIWEHEKELRSLGYESAEQFMAETLLQITAVYDKGNGYDLVADVRQGEKNVNRVVIYLKKAGSGEFYDVGTAHVIRKGYFKNKKPLWERTPNVHNGVANLNSSQGTMPTTSKADATNATQTAPESNEKLLDEVSARKDVGGVFMAYAKEADLHFKFPGQYPSFRAVLELVAKKRGVPAEKVFAEAAGAVAFARKHVGVAKTETPTPTTELKPNEFEALTPSAENAVRVKGHYRVVDLSELKFVDISDKAQQDEQERNRSGKRTEEQVQRMLVNFEAERLGDDRHTDRGAPIYRELDGGLRSVSGEGRSRLLKKVYELGGEPEAQYRAHVAKFAREHGIEIPEGVKQPVLLRVATDTGGLSWAQLAKASNTDMKSVYSMAEEAHADARELPKILNLLSGRSDEGILDERNNAFIMAFNEAVGAGTQYTQDRKSGFKETIGLRIENALVAYIINDREAATDLFDSPYTLGKTLASLRDHAVDLVRLKDNEQYDIAPELAAALKAALHVKEQKVRGNKQTAQQLIELYFEQNTFDFEKNAREGIDLGAAKILADLMLEKRTSRLGIVLCGYINEVERANGIDGNDIGLFGTQDWGTKSELMQKALDKLDGNAETQNRYSIIGERGVRATEAGIDPRTWELLGIRSYMQNLEVAREMEAAGKDRAEILRATGWYRGKDNKWRREIPDGQIKSGIEPHYDGEKWLSLGEFYDASELYKAYPELKEMRVEFGLITGALAQFDPVDKVILLPLYWLEGGKLKAKISTGEKLLPILVHEIQHAIQAKEGFAPGGNPDQENLADTEYKKAFEKFREERAEVERYIEQCSKELDSIKKSLDGKSRDEISEEDIARLLDATDKLNMARGDYFDIFPPKAPKLGLEGYRRLAGEVEARNVSRRLEDKHALPWRTEDVAEEEQIVLHSLLDSAERYSLTLREHEDAEARRIEAEARANGTWLKAPNGKPSKLNERQWVQVRTPAFKRWFGDWDRLAKFTFKSEKMRDADVHRALSGIARKDIKNAQTGIKAQLNSVQRTKILSKKAKDKTVSNGFTIAQHNYVASKVVELYEDAVLLGEFKDNAGDVNVKSIFRFFAPFVLDGQNVYALLTVKNTDGNKLYSIELDEIKKLDDKVERLESESERISSSSFGGSIDEVRNYVNTFFDVSKVVDENGEPLVVYHQTESGFWAFDMGKARQNMDLPAAYFSSGTEDWADMGGRVIPAFLNMRNPKTGKPAANGNGRAVRDALTRDGFDGTIDREEGMETEYAVFSPEQIKSATENVGTFDGGNADIRYSLTGAFHGSPHRFAEEDGHPFGRFRDDKMGSGEGAQAFGWGHYLTDQEWIARETYAERLAEQKSRGPLEFFADRFDDRGIDLRAGLKRFIAGTATAEEIIGFYKDLWLDLVKESERSLDEIYDQIDELEGILKRGGLVYEGKEHPMSESALSGCKDKLLDARRRAMDAEDDVYNKKSALEYIENNLTKETLVEFKKIYDSFDADALRRHLYTAEFDTGTADENLLDWVRPLTEEQFDRFIAELRKTDSVLAEKIEPSNYPELKKVADAAEAEFQKAVAEFEKDPSADAQKRMDDAEAKYRKAYEPILSAKRYEPLSEIHGSVRHSKDAKALSKAFFRAGFIGHKFPAASHGAGDYPKGTNYVIYDESALKITNAVRWSLSQPSLPGMESAGFDLFDKVVPAEEKPVLEALKKQKIKRVAFDAFRRKEGERKTLANVRDTFGLKDLKIGKRDGKPWTTPEEVYDALLDLAEIADIPPAAIGLDRQLTLEFTGRETKMKGGGYKPFPKYITAYQRGVVAHEWMHALDHYFGGLFGSRAPLNSYTREPVRAEVADAFKALKDVVEKSAFRTRSRAYSKRAYWGLDYELLARAFEVYAFVKRAYSDESMKLANEASALAKEYNAKAKTKDFDIRSEEARTLRNRWREIYEKAQEAKPLLTDGKTGVELEVYPKPEELESDGISPAFDKLFEALEWEQREHHVRLYSLSMQNSLNALEAIAGGAPYGVLHNAKYGEIHYPLGRMGKGGFGFLHIVEERMRKDGKTLDEALDVAIRVGISAEIGNESAAKMNTRWLDYGGTRAIVALTDDENPIITGYEISAGDSKAAYPSSSEPTASHLPERADEIVAALKEKLAQTRGEVNSEDKRFSLPMMNENEDFEAFVKRLPKYEPRKKRKADKARLNDISAHSRRMIQDFIRKHNELYADPKQVRKLKTLGIALAKLLLQRKLESAPQALVESLCKGEAEILKNDVKARGGMLARLMRENLDNTQAVKATIEDIAAMSNRIGRMRAYARLASMLNYGSSEAYDALNAVENERKAKLAYSKAADIDAAKLERIGAAKRLTAIGLSTDLSEEAEEKRRRMDRILTDLENEDAEDGERGNTSGAQEDADEGAEPEVAPGTQKKALKELEDTPKAVAHAVVQLVLDTIFGAGKVRAARMGTDLRKIGATEEQIAGLVKTLRKTATKSLMDAMHESVPVESRSRIGIVIGKISTEDNPTKIRNLLKNGFNLVALSSTRATRAQAYQKINKLLRPFARMKARESNLNRRVDGERELYLHECYKAWTQYHSMAKAAARMQEIQDELTALGAKIEPTENDDAKRRKLERELHALSLVGGARVKSVIDLLQVAWELEHGIESDKEEHEKRVEEVRERNAIAYKEIAAAVKARKAVPDRKQGALEQLFTSVESFKQRLEGLIRFASGETESRARERLEKMDRDLANAAYKKESLAYVRVNALREALEKIFGKGNIAKELESWHKIDERLAEFSGDGETALSLAQVANIYAQVRQEHYAAPLKERGAFPADKIELIEKRISQIPEMEKVLGEKGVAVVDALCGLLRDIQPEVRSAFKGVTGYEFFTEENYFPIQRQGAHGVGLGLKGINLSALPLRFSTRIVSVVDITEDSSIFDVFDDASNASEHFIAYSQVHLFWQQAFADPEFTDVIRRHHGKAVLNDFREHVTHILTHKQMTDSDGKAVDKLTSLAAISALGMNMLVALRQITGAPAFMFNMGTTDFGKYVGNALSPQGWEAAKEIIKNNPWFRTRVGKAFNDELRAIVRGDGKFSAGKARALAWYMISNNLGDAVPILFVGQGIFRATYEACLKQGMSAEQAKEAAHSEVARLAESSQQSNRVMNMSAFNRKASPIARAVQQFKSTTQQFLSYEVRAISDVMARPTDAARWRRLGKVVMLNHFILPGTYTVTTMLWDLMIGNDMEEWSEDWFSRFVMPMILGPASGIFFVGDALTTLGGGLSRGLPAAEVISRGRRLWRAGTAMIDDDTDKALDETFKFFMDNCPPLRHAYKLYENRIEE